MNSIKLPFRINVKSAFAPTAPLGSAALFQLVAKMTCFHAVALLLSTREVQVQPSAPKRMRFLSSLCLIRLSSTKLRVLS